MLTYQCTAQCQYCGTFSSPNDKNKIDLQTAISAIDQAKELDFGNIVFTGGEATIEWESLVSSIKYAKSKGFPVRLVTNAHWASSDDQANAKIMELKAAGLDEINYSTGNQHIKFIPLSNIYRAISASLSNRLTTVLIIELHKNSLVSKDKVQFEIDRLIDSDLIKRYFKIIESPWMPTNPDKVGEYPSGLLKNKSNIDSCTGCDSVLQTYVLQGDGRISSCCGLGMRMIPELQDSSATREVFLEESIKSSTNDWFKLALKYIGPEKILAWAAEKNKNIVWEDMYAHRCQSCIRIYKDREVRSTIKEHFRELVADLCFSIYLDEKLALISANR
ncbi:radical SAM protein [Deinococcus aquaedulcis]|uniref:radical SAM protein n=1 Tax=Deinococcus aquaedulcis TaxID=2840455 RepID=UPI001C8294BA|nr:radical SAM protein [Deinococcus aquaedulcis]